MKNKSSKKPRAVDLDTTTIAAIIGITNTASIAIGVLGTRGVDAYLRIRRQVKDESQRDDLRIDRNYQIVIAELKGQLDALHKYVEQSRKENMEQTERLSKEHIECVRIQGELKGRLEELEKAMWRHDEANRQHIVKLQEEVAKVESEQGKVDA